MTETNRPQGTLFKIFNTIKQALKGDENFDYTSGSIKKSSNPIGHSHGFGNADGIRFCFGRPVFCGPFGA